MFTLENGRERVRAAQKFLAIFRKVHVHDYVENCGQRWNLFSQLPRLKDPAIDGGRRSGEQARVEIDI